MKKLMFAMAAVAAGAAFADGEIVSANIVGYNTATITDGTVFTAVGPSFIDVGADGTFTLDKAFKPNDLYDWSADKLYLVNPTTCEADKVLVYDGEGWLDENAFYEPCGEEPLDLGTGFQSQFSSSGLAFQSSGQVFGDGFSVESEGKVFQFIVNGTGRDVNWSEITASGDYDWTADKIYILDPITCEATNVLVYDGEGWLDEGNSYEPYTEDLAAGMGFQTQFSEGSNVSIDFPPAIDAE